MPANQGNTDPNWSPQPDIRGHELCQPVPLTETYVPRSFDDCVRYVIECANLPEVDIYAGLPESQVNVATSVASELYEPNKDIIPAIRSLLQPRVSRAEKQRTALVVAKPEVEIFSFENRAPKKELPTRYAVVSSIIGDKPKPSPMLTQLRRSRVSA